MGFDGGAALDFNNCLLDIMQDDMPFKGFWFTWTNKRGGDGSNKSKLDRVLTNVAWLDLFPNAEASFLAPGMSDHCLISVSMVPPNGRRKPFKFFNFWLQHPEFSQILNNSWSAPLEGRPMFVLSSKLKRLSVLKQLNLIYYSNISKRVMEVRTELSSLQERLLLLLMRICAVKRSWFVNMWN